MITFAKAAKTSMRRIVRRDKSQKVVAEAPKDAEPQNMFSRFRRPASPTPKGGNRVVPDATTTSLPTTSTRTSTASAAPARQPRKAMRTAVNKIKQHVSETLERLRSSLRGSQKNLAAAVARTMQLEQQAELLSAFIDTAGTAVEAARQHAYTAAAAVGVLEHLESQLAVKAKELDEPASSSPELREVERSLRQQHDAIVKQKAQVKQWYSNAAEAQAVQERASEVVGGAREAFEAAQRDMAAASTALYEAQRAALAAKQMIMQAVSRAHLDDLRLESRASELEEEQLVLADRDDEVAVVGHVSLVERLRMEQGEIWQEMPAELLSVYDHSAVVPQREDYEAAKVGAQVASGKRELVGMLAAEVATLASAGSGVTPMWTSRQVHTQLELDQARKEECENKVRYLAARLNWVRLAAAGGKADDTPWVASMKLPEAEVDNDPAVVAAIEQLHVAKADLLAIERKLASLDCTDRLQSLYAEITGRRAPEGESVTQVATQLMKGAVLCEIRAYRDAKYAQHAVLEACEAVLKGVREAMGQKATPERSLSLMGFEPKHLQYFMQFYMDTLPKRLSTRPRATNPAPPRSHPTVPPPPPPSPFAPSTPQAPLLHPPSPLPSPLIASSSTNGSSPSNGTNPSNGVPTFRNGVNPSIGVTSSQNGVTPSIGGTSSNGLTSSQNGVTSPNGLTSSRNGATPSDGLTSSRNGGNLSNGLTFSRNGVDPSIRSTQSSGSGTPSNGLTTSPDGFATSTNGLTPSFGPGTPNAYAPQDRQAPSSGPDIARVRAALQGFLGEPDESGVSSSFKAVENGVPSSNHNPSFNHPGGLGKSRQARGNLHPLAGTSLEVSGSSPSSQDVPEVGGSSLEAVVELDSALLESVRSRLALAHLLEKGDNKVVRELVNSQLAADARGGRELEQMRGRDGAGSASVGVEGGEAGVVSEEAVDRIRHWYALQYMLERAAAAAPAIKVANKPSSPPPAPATPQPLVPNTNLSSFVLSSFSDDSGSEGGDSTINDAASIVSETGSVQEEVVKGVIVEEVVRGMAKVVVEGTVVKQEKFSTPVAAVINPLELAKAFSVALRNETDSKPRDVVFSTPVTPPSTPRATPPAAATAVTPVTPPTPSPPTPSLSAATPISAQAAPRRTPVPAKKSNRASSFKWPALTVPTLSLTPPTWTEINTLLQQKGELVGSLLALTLASWGGLVALNMDAAAGVSTAYMAAGVAALSAISTQSEAVAVREAAAAAAAAAAEREQLAADAAAAAAAEAAAAEAAALAAAAEAAVAAAAAARAVAAAAAAAAPASKVSPLTKAWSALKQAVSSSPPTNTPSTTTTSPPSTTYVSPRTSFVTESDAVAAPSPPASPHSASLPPRVVASSAVEPIAANGVSSDGPTPAATSSAAASTADSSSGSQPEDEAVKGTFWQRGKAWFTRVNARRPELTGFVMGLGLGTLGCFAAPVVHL